MLRVRARAAATAEWLISGLHLSSLGGEHLRTRPERLVFVCTGNICRSAYAEWMAKAEGMNAVSAGVAATPGLPANPQAIVEAKARGIDLSAHRTSAWSEIELKQGDVILAAELHHLLAVKKKASDQGCAVALMSAYSRPGNFSAVRDPYGHDAQVFKDVFDVIDRVVRNLKRSWPE